MYSPAVRRPPAAVRAALTRPPPAPMIIPVWRPEDEALVERLENELVLERAWRFQAGETAPPPHPRAAGMIALVRKADGGAAAVAAALEGGFEGLFARLFPAKLAGQPPELLHHTALYYNRLADALAEREPGQSVFARVRALASWVALGEERTYLRALASAIAGGALSESDVERAAESAVTDPFDDLARIAREGAAEQTAASRLALQALAQVDETCRLAGVSEVTTAPIARRAERARSEAAEAALAPIQEALAEAAARGDSQLRAPDLFQRVAGVWAWSGEDEAVEIFAVEQVTPIAWDIQRESRWADLGRLLAPVLPLSERLAKRIEEDPTRIAYAGPCAQMYVFRVEMAQELEQRLALAERSVKLCPSHRNGRLVLASALVDKAYRILNARGWAAPPDALANAEALVERAEQLFPSLKKLEDIKKRIEDIRKNTGAAPR